MSLMAAMEDLRGQPYPLILDSLRQQTEPAVGKIRGDKLKLLQSFIGATGLRTRLLSAATPEQIAAAASIAEAIQPAYLAKEDTYSINLADPQVATLLAGAVSAGLLSPQESHYLTQLAMYQKPLWPDVKMRDVVTYFEPSLIAQSDAWQVVDITDKRRIEFTLNAPAPEQVHVVFQMTKDGQNWFHATAIHGVQALRPYYADVPYYGYPRAIRWRSDYVLDAVVAGV